MLLLKKENTEQCCLGKASSLQPQHYPVNKVKDPTGAGDTFAGGFAGFLSQRQRLRF